MSQQPDADVDLPPELPPLPDAEPRPDGTRVLREVTYAVPLGFRPLALDLVMPSPRGEAGSAVGADGEGRVPVACVVWVHGGAWWEGDRRRTPDTWPPDALEEAVVGAGMALARVDYRLSGEAPHPAQLADVQAAIRFVRAHAQALGIDPERIGVFGESAGGHLAALAALTGDAPAEPPTGRGVLGPSSAVQAAVAFYPVTDLLAMEQEAPGLLLLGPTADAEVARQASPLHHARPDGPPLLVVHGDADVVVPVDQGERLAEAIRGVGGEVTLHVVPGADHCFRGVDPVPLIAEAVDFLAGALVDVG